MVLLNAEVQNQIRQAFADLTGPVKLVLFTQGQAEPGPALECDYCAETRQLLEEVTALSAHLSLEVRDFVADSELAGRLGVDKIPAVAILAGGAQPKDYGIRLYGIPSGYEFATLVEDIKMVSRGAVDLAPQTRQALARLDQPVHIQVYVTPTCPYCPRAVVLAHKLAMASELVTADMVEASEFPHLANRYQVYGVPRTVINDVIHIEGALPEPAVIQQLLTVLDGPAMDKLRVQWEASLN
jgi:glutaredoxin-like protein